MLPKSLKKCIGKRCPKMNMIEVSKETVDEAQDNDLNEQNENKEENLVAEPKVVKNINNENGDLKLTEDVSEEPYVNKPICKGKCNTQDKRQFNSRSVETNTEPCDACEYTLCETESSDGIKTEKYNVDKTNGSTSMESSNEQKLTVNVGTNTNVSNNFSHNPSECSLTSTKSCRSLNANNSGQVAEINLEQEKSIDYVCSLYVTACPTIVRLDDIRRDPVNRHDLEEAIDNINPCGIYKVTETKCGLIASFTNEIDADNLLLAHNLAKAMHGPVQVARFSRRDTRYKQIVTLRDVPWSIPMQDICTALTFQGVSYENVDRFRNNVRVEVCDATHYESLISQGLNFFDAARFAAVPDRWYRNIGQNSANGSDIAHSSESDSVLQCYRCQGFWHVAANCRHLPRCVRCGEPHGVEFCPRPRNNPICCHCSGAHHAAYKNCPVRVQLGNAFPVSMSLSTVHSNESPREIRSRCRS